jgi:hypothetical protein
MFKHLNPLSGRKSALLFHTYLRAQLSEKKKVRQVRAGAGRDTKVVATVAQDPRSRPRPVPSKCLSQYSLRMSSELQSLQLPAAYHSHRRRAVIG